jgi:outer membrane protein assembly factor BamB
VSRRMWVGSITGSIKAVRYNSRMGRLLALAILLPLIGLADWPEFRGPTGQGIAAVDEAPLHWTETENVAWKASIPGRGWSSPVIRDGVVWLTTATEGGLSLRVVAVDATTGEVTRDIEVFRLPVTSRKHDKNTFASPTLILTEDRVYVHFGARGTAALDTDGNVLWRNNEHRYEDVHGSGGSPVLWNDLLIINCDGADTQYVAALDAASGETVWTADRKASRFSYSTPLLIPRGESGLQVVSAGADMAASYDPTTGEELWRLSFDGFSVVPRPVYGNGLVYLTTGFYNPILLAIRPDGSGDVSLTHVVWQVNRGVPLTSSPLLDGERLYMVSDSGIASCFDASSGRELWRMRMTGAYASSPVLAAGRVYFTNEVGQTTIIESSSEYVEVARNEVLGRTLSSLAFSDGAMFLRSDTTLYRIEQ